MGLCVFPLKNILLGFTYVKLPLLHIFPSNSVVFEASTVFYFYLGF